jgi:ribosomal protein L12E/L44/L45/RPP1/RPP2
MTELEFESKLAELDRLLNDPEVQMDPHRVWSLLAELSAHELRGRPARVAATGPGAAASAAAARRVARG